MPIFTLTRPATGGQQVARAAAGALHHLRDPNQATVAGQVAKTVVVGLEVICIDHQQGNRFLFAAMALPFHCQLVVQLVVHLVAIGNASEPVGVGQHLQFGVGLKQFLLGALKQGDLLLQGAPRDQDSLPPGLLSPQPPG
jgi:hypothetical protein